MRPHPPWLSRQYLALSAAAILSVCLVAACSSSGSSSTGTTNTSSPTNTKPIVIGASLSLTGDFSADGQAFERGYKLWASDVNSSGGLLGRQVQLKILNDNSSPTQAQTNYQTLFSADKVDLAFGPFSSLLTTPSASVAARYNYALVEGAGGAPTVFNSPANQSAHNIFDVSLPIEDELIPFVNWVASLPPGQRPKTAAYPMADDPFADPPVQLAQQKLQALGVKTVYSKIFPAENASYKPAADQVANTGAQAVLLGSTDVPTVSAFMQAFEQQHYNPKMFICAAGPDQGASFTSAVGKGNATGMMVPNGWYPGYANPASQKMVNEYVAKYGGSPSDVNADVAEAYSVGQVMAQAVTGTKGTDNPKIITYLHSGVTISTVQGPVRFDNSGRNASAAAFTFQWQQQGTAFKQVLPVSAAGSVTIINPKPNWTSLPDGTSDLPGYCRWHPRRRRLRPDGRRPDADLRRARHHQHRPGCPGHPGRLPQLRAVRADPPRPVPRPAGHRAGHVRDRRRHPVGVHPAAARPGANIDDAAGHLRGRADHRGDSLRDLRAQPQAAQRLVRAIQRARVRLLPVLHLPVRLRPGAGARRGHLRAAVPDRVRAQRAGHDAGPYGGAAHRHRR